MSLLAAEASLAFALDSLDANLADLMLALTILVLLLLLLDTAVSKLVLAKSTPTVGFAVIAAASPPLSTSLVSVDVMFRLESTAVSYLSIYLARNN